MTWQIFRNRWLQNEFHNIRRGDVTYVDQDWYSVFLLIPRRTVGRRWIWGRAYCRHVWVFTGFVDEPERQYGNLFDVLKR